MKPGIAALSSLLLALCLAGPVAAQSVRATLVEAERGAPVDGVRRSTRSTPAE